MKIKDIKDEIFQDYKKPSMFICAHSCTFKCCTEAGIPTSVCQNSEWALAQPVIISEAEICARYLNNQITSAIVIGGLEPLDQFWDIMIFLWTLRDEYKCNDDVVIYTGYNEDEVQDLLKYLKTIPNIYIKFGRYIPGHQPHYDEVLGVELASDNQYGIKIS